MKKKKEGFTIDDKRKIVDNVKLLSKDAHMEIFYFLQKHTDLYTINANGVFYNLNNFDDKMLYGLEKMIKFYHKNEKKLKESYIKETKKII